MATKASKKSKTNEVIGYVVILAVIAVVLAAIFYVYKAQKLSTLSPEESQTTGNTDTTKSLPTPTPTPTKLFHGKDTYNLSGGAPDNPHFPDVSIDPLDPAVGARQIYTVKITSKYPVTKAFLSIRTDTKTSQLPLSLTSGTADNGTWQASWTMPETYIYNYQITLTAQTAYTQGSATITVRQRP